MAEESAHHGAGISTQVGAVLALVQDPVIVVDTRGIIAALSPQASTLLGADGETALVGTPFGACWPDERDCAAFLTALGRGATERVRVELGHAGSTTRPVWLLPVPADRGLWGIRIETTDGAFCTRHELERELRHLSMLIDACAIVPWRSYPSRGYASEFASTVERLTGFSAADYARDPWLWQRQIVPDDLPLISSAQQHLAQHGSFHVEFRVVTATGETHWLETQAVVIDEDVTAEPEVRGFVRDVTERREAEARILHMAHHDMLTGLPNRNQLSVILDHAVERSRRSGEQLAVMFLDLDDFKDINDAMGHQVGDEVLKIVSQRIKGAVRAEDFVARLGGDEFVILLEGLRGGPTQAARVAEKILERLGEFVAIGGFELKTRGSLGIALCPDSGTDSNLLLRNADAAMYRAKRARDSGVAFYSPELTEQSLKRLEMENALRRALERDALELHYQPQLCTETGRVLGLEALLRWRDKGGLYVSPAEFIPLAEESGLIIKLGRWAMLAAMRQAVVWRESGIFDGYIAVNVAARQIQDDNFLDHVQTSLAASGAEPAWFEFELTESGLLHSDREILARLRGLRELGFALALDDFGTGYSSLSYLKRFPLTRLKIDRSFVAGLPDDADDAALVQAIIAVADALGLVLAAEGIENAAQEDFLVAHGCRTMQGFLYARPMPADALEQWLAARLPAAHRGG